jgi:hypothetical protein
MSEKPQARQSEPAPSQKGKRTRCPNGSRKDKRSGECVKKGERGPQKKITIFRKQNKNLIRDYKMSSETRENYENALDSLKRNQIVDLFKKIKNVLELNVGKKSKNVLVKEIMDLHGSGSRPNMFNGKQLLSFEKDSHIKIPKRETREEGRKAKAEKEVKRVGAKKELLDKEVQSRKKKLQELTEARKETAQKILNAEKREKAKDSKSREKRRKLADIIQEIADVRKRLRGASKETMAELREKMVMLSKRLADVKK